MCPCVPISLPPHLPRNYSSYLTLYGPPSSSRTLPVSEPPLSHYQEIMKWNSECGETLIHVYGIGKGRASGTPWLDDGGKY